MKRRLHLPETIEVKILELLSERNLDPQHKAKDIAAAITKLSNFYLQNPMAPTPWQETWAQVAYLAYYLPLNLARNQAVFDEAQRTGFTEGLETLIDFGSGLGSGFLAWTPHDFKNLISIDRSTNALKLQTEFLEAMKPIREQNTNSTYQATQFTQATQVRDLALGALSQRAVLASYALTELDQENEMQTLPQWMLDSEALIIIEPSTREDGRKLLLLRQSLIDQGFSIWAPCTHQGHCPLLVDSEKDWCHDRIHWNAPNWWRRVESFLPMKNATLTFSYLLARKKTRIALSSTSATEVRVIGDTLDEKGKSRQLICQSSEREFLTWFPQRWPKNIAKPEIYRGDLIEFKGALHKKSNEVRITSPDDFSEITTQR